MAKEELATNASRPMDRLLFGDNLRWLRDKNVFPDASVDLVYLAPPFNSNASRFAKAEREGEAEKQVEMP